MQERLRQLLEKLKSLIDGMSQKQRITAVVGGLFILLALGATFYITSRPDFVPVFTDLSEQDAAAITAKLKEMEIQFKLGKGGAVVMVPSRDADRAKLQLASEGLPQGGGIGWEFLEKNNFGDTEFSMNKKNLRAMQTELSRTIKQIIGIEQVRVHLALPEEKLFLDQKQDATASIMLHLHSGMILKNEQIRGIVHLVARSVPGLKPGNVTVVDTHGNILSHEENEVEGGGKLSATQLDIQKKVEKEIQVDVQSLLDNVVGYTTRGLRKAIVRVRAQIEFDEKKIESQTFEAPSHVRSKHEIKETYTGAPRQGGAPGTATNVPGGAGTPGYPLGVASGGNYNKEETTVNNELSSKKEVVTTAPGTSIKRLQVGVLVDSTLPQDDLRRIEKVVAEAAGVNATRGDTIQVQSVPFDYSWMEQEIQTAEREQNWKKTKELVWAWLPLVLLGIVLIWGATALMRVTEDIRREKAREKAAKAALEIPAFIPPPPPLSHEEEFAEERAAKQELIDILKKKGAQTSVVLDEVEQLVHSKPEIAAELIRSWLVEK